MKIKVIVWLLILSTIAPQLQAQDMDPIDYLMKGIKEMLADTTGTSDLLHINDPLNNEEKNNYLQFMNDMMQEFFASDGPKGLDTLGEKAFLKGEYQEAIDYFEQYATDQKKANNRKNYAYAIRRLSTAHAYISNYQMATLYGLKALQLDEQFQDSLGIASDYISLGMVHLNIKEYDSARNDFSEALKHCSGRDAKLERNALYYLGSLSLNTGNHNLALQYFQKARQFDKLAKNWNNLIDDACTLSYTYFTSPQPDSVKAIKTIIEGVGYLRQNAMQVNSVNATVKLAGMLRLLGKYEDAMQMLSMVTGYGYLLGQNQDVVRAKGLLARVYADKKEYEKAYNNYMEYQKLNDALFNENKNREVKKLEVEYETAKKEKALAKSEKERKEKELILALKEKELLKANLEKSEREKTLVKSQNIIQQNRLLIADKDKQRIAAELTGAKREKQMAYLGTTAAVLLVVLSLLYYFRQKKLEQQFTLEALKAAKSQMARHVTFNTLQSIREVVQDKPESADDYILRFSRFIRGVLENSDTPETTLSQEVSELENYIEFEKMRSNNSFDYRLTLAPNIDASRLKVPSLILQPIVENSILHGFKKLGYMGQLDISIVRNKGALICNVRDNGKGRQMNKQTLQPGRTSKGTKITHERIQIYNRIANRKAYFEIKDLNPGVEVTLTLPEVYENTIKN